MTTMQETTPPGEPSDSGSWSGPLRTSDQVRNRVLRVAGHLLAGQSPYARAGRAQLRSALGKEVGLVPAIWQFTVDVGPSTRDDTEPTRGELAVHMALALWAVHQGSHLDPVHRRSETGDRSIAAAARRLADNDKFAKSGKELHETPIYARLSALVRATTFDSLVTQARGIVNLLSSANDPMDYGQFAVDLFQWQDLRYRSAVIRRWGRDFERTPRQPLTDASADADMTPHPS